MKKDSADALLTKKGANFFGFEIVSAAGKKKSQPLVIRGNGDLALTKEAVIFKRWLPKKTFEIPLEKISNLEIKRAHNLKTKLLPLLRIHYRQDGEVKIFGVCVGFLDETNKWRDEITKAREVSVPAKQRFSSNMRTNF